MKISYNWLKKHIDLSEAPENISKLLTDSGLEVEKLEEFESIKGGLKDFVIGQVRTCEKHPGADKLKKTTVDIGNGTIVPIVCGAANVAIGQKVIVATIGSTIYPLSGEPFKINKAKIRGEVSEGMICAEDEIGIGQSHDGILVLDTDLPPGSEAKTYFNIESDFIFEIGLTPNRADAASHLGVARDLKALLKRNLRTEGPFEWPTLTKDLQPQVLVENKTSCPRYSGICISGIQVKDSPQWLQQALLSIGLHPINNVVDVTNFIMHDLGQPLHAFDFDKIEGGQIIVKNLPEGTEFITLDGVTRKLSALDLMICDVNTPLAIAGVFGGKSSGITEKTSTIFLESAYFSHLSVRKTSLFHGLKTDASFRFERGTDPNMTVIALQKAVSLILELCGGGLASALIDVYLVPIPHTEVVVDTKRIHRLIGKEIPRDEIVHILNNLDIEAQPGNNDIIRLSVPPYRVDVKREADIVEEILRIYGLNNIELSSRVQSSFIAEFPAKDKDLIQSIVSSLLVPYGFFEVITNSLTRSAFAELLKIEEASVKILNPLSETLNVMRQSLLFSGLEVLAYNLNRQQKDLKIFEFGKVYTKQGSGYIEKNRLSMLLTGHRHGENFETQQKEVDIQFLKLLVHTICAKLGLQKLKYEVGNEQVYQDSITVKYKGQVLLTFGSLKNEYTKPMDIKQQVCHADFDADLLLQLFKQEVIIKEIPKFPEVRRDLSLVLDRQITFQQINDLALKIENRLLKNLNVFDIYEGEKIGTGKKSYSVSFLLQDTEQTLTDKVIDQTMSKLINSFEKELGAVIRNKNESLASLS